jgi:hypothetical protein
VTGRSPLVPEGDERNGRLALPDASFLRRFDTALRGLERARTLEAGAEAHEELDGALRILETLDAADPANPATAFWIGRAHRQKARFAGSGIVLPWLEAFRWFQEAGRRGYQEPRTVSLMLEAAHHAGEFPEMRKAALLAERSMDGDASFWTWVALAHVEGGRAAAGGVLTTEDRARADEALRKALDRARSEAERERIREVRAKVL